MVLQFTNKYIKEVDPAFAEKRIIAEQNIGKIDEKDQIFRRNSLRKPIRNSTEIIKSFE